MVQTSDEKLDLSRGRGYHALMTNKDLDAAIRRVPDFPKPGIRFYDITSVLANPRAFAYSVDCLTSIVRDSRSESVAAIEARGFVFASAIAYRLGLPLILVRKKGKLPNVCRSQSFDLEYGSDVICVQELDLVPGRRVHLLDDLIATGGTLKAACDLFEGAGLVISGISAVIGLPFLGYPQILAPRPVHTLIDFDSE
jgi:adenine phosphoribosyltransferase